VFGNVRRTEKKRLRLVFPVRASLKGYERRSTTKRPKLVQPGEAQAMIAPGWFHCLVGAKHGSN
jgi:hypothetical protein